MRKLIYAVSGLIVFMATSAQANLMPEEHKVETVYMSGRAENNASCSLFAKVVNGNVEKLTIRTGYRVVCSGNHQAVTCLDVKDSAPIVITNEQVSNMIFRRVGKRAVIRGSIDLRSQYEKTLNPGPEKDDEWPRSKKLLRIDFQNGVENGFYFSFAATGTSKFDQETRVWCKK